MAKQPLLSIGMIFKNEVRCLERCMKSLQPLREAVPCELVMADTGSNDGSRDIAAKYADILFDFPWVNDFSAARNAVMDHSSGKWFMTIDADEWLDDDIGELLWFLGLQNQKESAGAVILRDYFSYDKADWDEYNDALLVRILRMDTGLRYEGAIHESWILSGLHTVACLRNIIIHHDGYACFNTGEGDEKRTRNIRLLRAALAKEPNQLLLLQQFIDAGVNESDYLDVIRRAVSLVEGKQSNWKRRGPSIYRSAIVAAHGKELPELDMWIRRAETLFPDSFMTRLDVEYIAFTRSVEKKERKECVERGERWLAALEDYRSGRGDPIDMLCGAVFTAKPSCEAFIHIFTANATLSQGNAEKSLSLLNFVKNGAKLQPEHIENFLKVLQRIHALSSLDTAPLLLQFWEQIQLSSDKWRQEAFFQTASNAFSQEYLRAERNQGFQRRGATLYAPLVGQHILGTAAAILGESNTKSIMRFLDEVEDWNELPIAVLFHALEFGIVLPLADKPMELEEMDTLAARLAQDPEGLREVLRKTVSEDFHARWQTLAWARALALAGVQACDWTDEARGMELCRTFVKVEREFLPQYYNPELLCAENIHVLPPLHRFGWYCGLAFEALDGGDIAGYVRLLREGLAVCEGMKPMVEFLTDHTPQLQTPKPSGELLALAEQVRMLLAQYPADDPAVAALKQSPAYQKVAHLIEGPDLGVLGGLKQ